MDSRHFEQELESGPGAGAPSVSADRGSIAVGSGGDTASGEFTELPVLRHERIWGFWQFTSVNVGLAIATWAFLGGGALALFVGAKTAIAATVIGNLVGVALVALTTCLPSSKYGVEQYTALRTVFGVNGVRALFAAMFPLAAAGWNAVLAVMCSGGRP